MAQLKQMINKNKFYIIGTLILFLFLFYCSTKLCMNVAPDEYMRYDIPLFIYNHSYLPKGDEKEILNAIWGFSYGFTPYLPSIISFFFMKIASIFTTAPVHLLIVARLTSVLAGALTFFVCCKIGEEIFNHKMTIYLFAIFVSLLPQFMYLSLYLNNDSFSIFTTALIVYGWIKGIKTNWNCKWCIFLGVAIGICALTYYNAYGFILCSIIVYCMSSYKLHFTFNEFLKKGFLIAIAALVVGGWFFIRNAMIHNGDFLGMNSMYDCGEKYAMPGYQLSQRDTYQNQGISVFSMIFDTNWIITTIKSFICTTGYMQYMISGKHFYLYLIIILFGMIMMLIALKRKYQFKFKFENYFIICLILCILIPIILSIKYSYSIDYQPKGRYIMSILIPIALFMSIGYEYFSEFIENKIQIKSRYIELSMIGIYILLFVICYSSYIAVCFGSTII